VHAGNGHGFVPNAKLVFYARTTPRWLTKKWTEKCTKSISASSFSQTLLLIRLLFSTIRPTTVGIRNNFQQSHGGKKIKEWLSVHNVSVGEDVIKKDSVVTVDSERS
jgi:hypothetical protein